MRTRSWCFTSYAVDKPVWNDKRMAYLLYAPEVCPTTGKKHWQGYVYYKEKVSLKMSQKLLATGEHHHDPCIGTATDNYNYIVGPYEKDDKVKPHNPDFEEFGVMPKQGMRRDLNEIKDKLLKQETTINNILTEEPILFHQYGRTLERLDDLRMCGIYRTEMTTGLWLWGKTGAGKSHRAFEGFDPKTHYVWNTSDNGWWENYQQQEIVIINELREGGVSYDMLLQLLDKWPYTVKRRGRPPLPFTSKKIIITSSLPPKHIFKMNGMSGLDKLEQLYRRCEVKNMGVEFMDDYGNYIDD